MEVPKDRRGWNVYVAALGAAHAFFLGLTVQPVQAGRPMIVDDAALVESGHCQLETWLQDSRESHEYWAVPACNFSGNLEIALGSVRTTDDEQAKTGVVLQGKTLFKVLDADGWGAGLVFGNLFTLRRGSGSGDIYASLPVSFSFLDDRLRVHTNLGWLRESETHRHAATWGVGAEMQLNARTGIAVETFGQSRERPLFHVAVRHWVIPERVQIDASYGNRFGMDVDGRFLSIGLVLFSDAIFP